MDPFWRQRAQLFRLEGHRSVATMQIKIAFLSSISYACLNVWRCVATSFSWLYVLLLCYHAFAIVLVVKNEWLEDEDDWNKIGRNQVQDEEKRIKRMHVI